MMCSALHVGFTNKKISSIYMNTYFWDKEGFVLFIFVIIKML